MLLRSLDAGVATLTLNRPAKLNAISYELMSELRAALDELAGREDVTCVVIAGAGRSFSAGFDLATLPDDPAVFRFMAETIDALEVFPRPTIARIHGHCMTGALELALACDVLIAADDAVFADTHSRFGIVPVCGMSVRLPERIGAARAKLLSFSGRRLTAVEAERWGLVEQVVARAELDATARELTDQIAATSADANRILKALVRAGIDGGSSRDDALRDERSLRFGIPADREARLSTGGHR
jgi:enoyl-CoA hydratase/carnithine racemase